jgi:hypothetical protein
MFHKLFLDMDGVIVDFEEGVRKRYNAAWWYPTEWKIPYEKFSTNFKTFWADLNNEIFWAYLPWTEDGKRVVSLVEPFRPTILTASLLPQATAGKLYWLKKNYPDTMKEGQRRVLIANGHEAKQSVAGPGKILIDDNEDNIADWEAAGGAGILYPRPWNRLRDTAYPVEYLCSTLMALMGGE